MLESSEIMQKVIDIIIFLLPIILPFILAKMLFKKWVGYARGKFLSEQKYVMLKIIPPKNVLKGPQAMELVLVALHHTGGEATWIDRFWKGKVRPDSSLELVSIEGEIHFIIRIKKDIRRYVETQLYSTYPGIEVHECEDYTAGVEYDNKINKVFCSYYALTKPDPYPIKTYVDYGLDQEAEEEFKIDPLAPVLEFMGGLGPGHQIWIQFIIRAHKPTKLIPLSKRIFGNWDERTDTYIEQAKIEIEKIRQESITITEEGDTERAVSNQTKGQQLRIAAIERAMTKPAFDVGMRAIYIAHKDVYDGVNIAGLKNGFKQFSSNELNGLRPYTGDSDYPWDDPFGWKDEEQRHEYMRMYKGRQYFYHTKKEYSWWRPSINVPLPYFILNTEELATLFHFPGQVAGTPTLQRIESRKGTPPANLPI